MNDLQKQFQKETGIKVGDYNNQKNRIYNMCKISILMLENIWKDIVKNELQDSQICLDWLDKINEISTRN